MDNVIVAKSKIIENCLHRIHTIYDGSAQNLMDDLNKQDALVLNLQRAIQACIDLSTHISKKYQWGLPEYSRHSFEILEENNFLPKPLAANLKKMVGFRNLAVHDYQKMDMDILKNIVENQLSDIETFKILCLKH